MMGREARAMFLAGDAEAGLEAWKVRVGEEGIWGSPEAGLEAWKVRMGGREGWPQRQQQRRPCDGGGGGVGGGARSVRLRPPPPAPACRAVAGVVWANCLPEGLKADIADRAAPVLGVLVGVFELVLDWVIAGWDWLRAKLGGEEGWVGARGRDGREKTRAAAGATRPAPPLSPPLLCRPAAAQRGGRGRLL